MQIAVNGIEVAVERHGAGAGDGGREVTPLVLLHGFTGNATDWSEVVDRLAAHREVWTLEHRGHGSSSDTGDASTYTFDQLVDDLAAVLDTLEVERYDLLGHSMGGIVAQRYAVREPRRLRSLILMDTGGRPSPEGPNTELMRGGIELARTQGSMAVFEAISPFLGDGPAADAGRDRMRQNFACLDPVAFVALGEELLTYRPVLDRLAALTRPPRCWSASTTPVFREPATSWRRPSQRSWWSSRVPATPHRSSSPSSGSRRWRRTWPDAPEPAPSTPEAGPAGQPVNLPG